MLCHLRFFFECGVDTPLWPGPSDMPDLDSPYGYPCAPEKLPITAATSNELTRLADLYQSSIDWDHPTGPSPWARVQQESFRRRRMPHWRRCAANWGTAGPLRTEGTDGRQACSTGQLTRSVTDVRPWHRTSCAGAA